MKIRNLKLFLWNLVAMENGLVLSFIIGACSRTLSLENDDFESWFKAWKLPNHKFAKFAKLIYLEINWNCKSRNRLPWKKRHAQISSCEVWTFTWVTQKRNNCTFLGQCKNYSHKLAAQTEIYAGQQKKLLSLTLLRDSPMREMERWREMEFSIAN